MFIPNPIHQSVFIHLSIHPFLFIILLISKLLNKCSMPCWMKATKSKWRKNLPRGSPKSSISILPQISHKKEIFQLVACTTTTWSCEDIYNPKDASAEKWSWLNLENFLLLVDLLQLIAAFAVIMEYISFPHKLTKKQMAVNTAKGLIQCDAQPVPQMPRQMENYHWDWKRAFLVGTERHLSVWLK